VTTSLAVKKTRFSGCAWAMSIPVERIPVVQGQSSNLSGLTVSGSL
jgi:hypothetical protein